MNDWPYISIPRPEFVNVITNLSEINIREFPEVIEKLPVRSRLRVEDAIRHVRHKHPLEVVLPASDIDLLTEKFLDLGLTTRNPFLIDNTVIVPPGD